MINKFTLKAYICRYMSNTNMYLNYNIYTVQHTSFDLFYKIRMKRLSIFINYLVQSLTGLNNRVFEVIYEYNFPNYILQVLEKYD